jgi:endonuclease/exonuclease/phosphatase (EEP) superfamily protein YafD
MSKLRAFLLFSPFYGIAGISTFLTCLSFFHNYDWRFAVLVHPRPQIALALVIALWGIVWHSRKAALLFLIVLLFNVGSFANLYQFWGKPTTPSTLTISHLNLDAIVRDHTPAFAYLQARGDDILLLQEVTPRVSRRFATAFPDYELVASRPLWNTHGSAVLVKKSAGVVVLGTEVVRMPAFSDRPLLNTQVEHLGKIINILSLHTIRPVYDENIAYQKLEFAAVAEWSIAQQAQGQEVLVIGDFNATPWSQPFRNLLSVGQLNNSQIGFGLQPTWNGRNPLLLRIPIDHAVLSAGIFTTARTIGDPVAGDHLPLHLGIAITP